MATTSYNTAVSDSQRAFAWENPPRYKPLEIYYRAICKKCGWRSKNRYPQSQEKKCDMELVKHNCRNTEQGDILK